MLACLTIVWGLFQPSWRKEVLLTAAFPLMYFAFILRFIVRNGRTILPLTPFVYILAAIGLFYFLRLISSKITRQKPRVLAQLVWLILVVSSISLPLELSLRQTSLRTQVDSRVTARQWIDQNLPEGATIALESYSPFASVSKFEVDGYPLIIDHTPDWYIAEGYDYLIFGEGMYGRFYLEPDRYAVQIEQYDAFFNQFEEVRTFQDGGYEVRIYKLP